MNFSSVSLRALAVGFALSPSVSIAQVAATDSPPEVVVTGTRAPGRSVVQSLAPIEIVKSDELETTGRPGLIQQLSDLVPSFTLPAISGQDASAAVRYGQLRGLSPDETLVLVNGKRRHNSALVNVGGNFGAGSVPVDLDFIPASAIDHVEILRDGAAAQYGSDAIAGVINIILKSGNEGGSVSSLFGAYDRGEGFTFQGLGDAGYKIGQGGSIHVFGEWRREDAVDRSSPSQNASSVNFGQHVELNHAKPEERVYQFGFNGDVPLNDDVTLYGFGTYGRRNALTFQSFRDATTCCDAFPAFYPTGYQPRLAIEEDDFALTAGLKGAVQSWNWDLSATYGRDSAGFAVENSVNTTLGLASPKNFDDGTEIFSQLTTTLDISRPITLPIVGVPASIAFGVEHRYEEYRIEAGEKASYTDGGLNPFGTYGSVSFVGFTPDDATDASRNVEAAYADLEADLTSRWRLGIAGRGEHYDDFGNVLSGKASTRYQVIDGLALRGTISNGFRAPALGQDNFSATSSNQFGGSSANIVYLKPGSPAALALGGGKLAPEHSSNYSVGFVAEPAHNLTVTVDAYQVDVNDRILLSTQTTEQFTTGTQAALQALGIQGVDGFQYFTNAANTRTRGIDLVSTYKIDGGAYGKFALTGDFAYNHTKILKLKPTPAALAALGATLFDTNRQGDITLGLPQTKFTLGVDWSLGSWSVNARETRYGQTIERVGFDSSADTISGAKWITDLSAAYRVTDAWTVAVGSNNLFNVVPGRRNLGVFGGFTSPSGGDDYPGTTPYGNTGGFYYLRTSYAF
jgi:iron complex outermembrane receptor protein